MGVPHRDPLPGRGQREVVIAVGPVRDEALVGQLGDHVRVRVAVGNDVAAHHQASPPRAETVEPWCPVVGIVEPVAPPMMWDLEIGGVARQPVHDLRPVLGFRCQ